MSVDYCHKHHNYYDTDFETECSLCVEDEVEQSEQKEDNKVFFIHGVRAMLFVSVLYLCLSKSEFKFKIWH